MQIPTQRQAHMDTFGATVLIGFSILLGLNQALVKLVNAGLSPLMQGGLRSAFALIIILVWVAYARKKLNLGDGTLGWGLLVGVLFSIEFACIFAALDLTTVARASLFFYTMPLFTALGAHFLFPGEQLTWVRTTGLIIAFAGVALALFNNPTPANDGSWLGDVLALIGALAWAGIGLTVRGTRLIESSAEQVLLYQLVVSAVVLTAAAYLSGDTVRNMTWSLSAIFAFQVITVASLGFLVWMWMLTIYPVTNIASFSLLSPIAGIFFGWLMFADVLTTDFVAAVGAVVIGLFLINTK